MSILVEYGDVDNLTGQIIAGNPVVQQFTAAGNYLVSLDICFATYCRNVRSILVMAVEDMSGQTVLSVNIPAAGVRDNGWHHIDVAAPLSKGDPYCLRLESREPERNNALTAKWGVCRDARQPALMVGGCSFDGELACRFAYEDRQVAVQRVPVRKQNLPVVSENPGIDGLVSVVIPYYRCSQYLAGCLMSLRRQTYRYYETIVVDDGSSHNDHCVDSCVVDQLFQNPYTILRHNRNGGAPAARNTGFKASRGGMLFFLDADVMLEPHCFATLLSCLYQHPEAGFAYGGFYWGNILTGMRHFDAARLRRTNYISTMSMVRRTSFPGFDESLRRHQDWDLWLTILESGQPGQWCGKTIFSTPQREGSISSGAVTDWEESVKIVKKKHHIP